MKSLRSFHDCNPIIRTLLLLLVLAILLATTTAIEGSAVAAAEASAAASSSSSRTTTTTTRTTTTTAATTTIRTAARRTSGDTLFSSVVARSSGWKKGSRSIPSSSRVGGGCGGCGGSGGYYYSRRLSASSCFHPGSCRRVGRLPQSRRPFFHGAVVDASKNRSPPFIGDSDGTGRTSPVIRSNTGTIHRFSSSPSSGEDDDEASEEDLLRWERMYEEGRSSEKESNPMIMADDVGSDGVAAASAEAKAGASGTSTSIRSEVRVVSFDLDNTLWKTSPTISAANDACAAFLNDSGVVQTERVEKVMGRLFKREKSSYCPFVDDDVDAKAPVLLTKLRKDAIREVLLSDDNGYDDDGDGTDALVDRAFEIWAAARHDAAANHLAGSAPSCLERIASSIRIGAGGGDRRVLIGAITDGNSDPRLVQDGVLSECFDFCVNAESVGVSKPDKRLYVRAVREALRADPSLLRDLATSPSGDSAVAADDDDNDDATTTTTMTDDMVEEMIGPWWVHVGDDFVKDIVASKSLNMRTIWSRELVLNDVPSTAAVTDSNNKSNRTVEDLVRDVSKMKVITMQMGAEDYLADGLREEFADAVVDRFDDIPRILSDWHQDGLRHKRQTQQRQQQQQQRFPGEETTGTTSTTVPPPPPVPVDSTVATTTTTAGPASEEEEEPNGVTAATTTATTTIIEKDVAAKNDDNMTTETKFCIFCGAKLPAVAKFCSSCGEKQP